MICAASTWWLVAPVWILACKISRLDTVLRTALRTSVPVRTINSVGMLHHAVSILCMEHILGNMLRAEAIWFWVSDEEHPN